MLMLVLHNRRDYLESLISLAKKEDIREAKIIEKKDIVSCLIAESQGFIFRKGSLSNAYDKTFVAVLKDEEKAKRFLDLIENDASPKSLNLEDKGFICTVPFQLVKDLGLDSLADVHKNCRDYDRQSGPI